MSEKSKTKDISLTPYLDAKREYNERYGAHIQQAKLWQRVGITCLLLCIVCVVVVLLISRQPAFVPYIVEIDKIGRVSNVSLDYNKGVLTPTIIKAHIANWLSDTRSIYSDGTAQRNSINRCFGSLSNNHPSFRFIRQILPQRLKRAKTESVSIEILSTPLMIAENSWQTEWKETVRSIRGEILREEIWKASLVLSIEGQPTKASLFTNPLGIYIKSIDWAKQSEETF